MIDDHSVNIVLKLPKLKKSEFVTIFEKIINIHDEKW